MTTDTSVVALAALLAFLVVTVPVTRAHPFAVRNSVLGGCERLSSTLYHVYREVMLPVYDREQVLAEIKMAAGINPENPQELKKFACSLEGSRSVKELSQHFRLPYTLTHQMYGELMDQLSKCGGVQGCQVYMHMMNDLSAWVQDVQYSSWPLHTTYAQASKFLRKMAAEYGADFLSSPGLNEKPDAGRPILVTEDNVDTLAQSLVEAKSLSDLARLTGIKEEDLAGLDAGLKVLVHAGKYVPSSNAALKNLMMVADQMGLLYLPAQ